MNIGSASNELSQPHEAFIKQHQNAAAKLQNRRLINNQSEHRVEMRMRGGGSELGARLQRLKNNFNQKVGPGSEIRQRQNSSEVGFQNHNALKQFAIDQLSILSSKQDRTSIKNNSSRASSRRRIIDNNDVFNRKVLNQTEKRQAIVAQAYSDEFGSSKHQDQYSVRSKGSAARLINRKLSFMDSRNQREQQKRSITFEKDDVAPRGGKATIEQTQMMEDKKLQEEFDPERFMRFSVKAKASEKVQNHINRPYYKNLERQNLSRRIRDRLRYEFRKMYQFTGNAFADLDFTGLGYITKEAFLNNPVVKHKVPFSLEELNLFFSDQNIFRSDQLGISEDNFKKVFFPQHIPTIQEPPDDFDDKEAQQLRNDLKHSTKENEVNLEKRVRALDDKLKNKFWQGYKEVTNAFKMLDSDFDGIVTVQDMMRFMSNDPNLDYNDLKKLFIDKDSKKEGTLNYADFCKWLGFTMSAPQGFYFRSASNKMPDKEMFDEKFKKTKESDIIAAMKNLSNVSQAEMENRIFLKIFQSFKQIRQAFEKINLSKSGKISKEELSMFISGRGILIDEDMFNGIFNKFDADKDGVIDYKDFVQALGFFYYPTQPSNVRLMAPKGTEMSINCCQEEQCFIQTASSQNYCEIHQKMHMDKSMKLFIKMYQQIGAEKWDKFITKVKSVANPEDQSQIVMKDFEKLVKIYGGKLTPDEFEYIRLTFPGKEIQQNDRDSNKGAIKTLNIVRIYGVNYNIKMDKVYNNINVEKDGAADDMFDPMGFYGRNKYYRPKIELKPISEEQFYSLFIKENKLKQIMLDITHIDMDRKKHVTNLELEDIIKFHYPEIVDRDISHILNKFCNSAMRIWISYPRWRDSVLEWMAKLSKKENVTAENSKIQKQIESLQTEVERHRRKEKSINAQLKEKISEKMSKIGNLESFEFNSGIQKDPKFDYVGYQKLSRSKLKKIEDERNGSIDSMSKVRPQTTMSVTRGGRKEPSYSHKKLIADLSEIDKRRRREQRPASQLSRRTVSIESGRQYGQKTSEYVNVNNLIKKEYLNSNQLNTLKSKNGTIQSPGYRIRDNRETMSRLRRRSVENEELQSGTKASIERRLRDYSEKIKNGRKDTYDETIGNEQVYENSRLVATDDGTLRKFIEFGFDNNRHGRNSSQHSKQLFESTIMGIQDDQHRSKSPAVQLTQRRITSALATMNEEKQPLSRDQSPNDRNMYNSMSLQGTLTNPGLQEYFNGGFKSPANHAKTMGTFMTSERNKTEIRRYEKALISKLAYEWRNIFRSLMRLACSKEAEKEQAVTVREFNEVCLRHQVNFTREELNQVRKHFGYQGQTNQEYVDFQIMSHQLGLHKGSYDFFSRSFVSQRSKSMHKLRQLYQSIEPVKEEQEEADLVRGNSERKKKAFAITTMLKPADNIFTRKVSTPGVHYLKETASQLAKQVNRQKLRRKIDQIHNKKPTEQQSNAQEVTSAINSNIDKFERLILLALRKKELNTQIVRNMAADEDMVILPIAAFKQVLHQIGVQVPDSVSIPTHQLVQILKRFHVRGDFKLQEKTDHSKESVIGSRAKSVRSLSNVQKEVNTKNPKQISGANKVVAVVNPTGKTVLGVDVEAFVDYYTANQ